MGEKKIHSGGNSCVRLLSCFNVAAGLDYLNNKKWMPETLKTVRWVEMMFTDVQDSEQVIPWHSDDDAMENQACG